MNETERNLVPYYDCTLDYYSPIDTDKFLHPFNIDWTETDSVLDLGCGDGRLADYLVDTVEYLGLDGSPGRIADAQDKRSGWHFRVFDLYDPLPLTMGRGKWSLICLFEVLEHLRDPIAVLDRAREVCQIDGRIIASVPLDSPGERHLQVYRNSQDAARALQATILCRFTRHVLLEW